MLWFPLLQERVEQGEWLRVLLRRHKVTVLDVLLDAFNSAGLVVVDVPGGTRDCAIHAFKLAAVASGLQLSQGMWAEDQVWGWPRSSSMHLSC